MESTILARIQIHLQTLRERGRDELFHVFHELAAIIEKGHPDTYDREALLKQIEVLCHQMSLPKEVRKSIQVNASLFYISLFSSVPEIGKFLIEHRDRLEVLIRE